jgi:tetratricopeptide (TPR) repeat protein
VWVTDFGLAQVQSDARLTATGDLVGTLRYMSPEQALAQRVVVDHRTDVYSLGATLYELLTLQPVFAGTDRQELLRQIAFEEPRPPRRLCKAIPTELETIVLKALEKNPADRYATAQELADDLHRFLLDQPVRARRPTLPQRARRWARRHQAIVWSAALIALILAGSLGWVVRDWQARRAEAEGRVFEALKVAEPKLREGNPHDPELVSSARKAEAQLASGVVGARLRHQVEQLLADLAMLERLEQIRLQAHADTRENKFDYGVADPAYARAFREYGIDVEALGGQEAAARIRKRAIVIPLSVALDDWAFARQEAGGANWRQLLEVAREADPDEWRCAFREARVSGKQEDLKKLMTSAPISKMPPTTLALFGEALQKSGAAPLAVTVLREGQRLYPADFWINEYLASTLTDKVDPPQVEEGIVFLRAALAIRPQSPGVHYNLGNALKAKGRLDEAIESYREAIRLKPDYAEVHNNLGNALKARGRLDEAIESYREAIRLKNDNSFAHNNLGAALVDKGRLDEAIASCQAAIRISKGPKDRAAPLTNLGNALQKQGDLDGAVACFREAIELDPNLTDAFRNLFSALLAQADYAGVVACYRHFEQTFANQTGWAEITLKDSYRLISASVVAFAGCGQSKDGAKLSGEERKRLREQALAWLRVSLQSWNWRLLKDPVKIRPLVEQETRFYQITPLFAGVRDREQLDDLPEAERLEWQKLWEDVAELRKRAAKPKSSERTEWQKVWEDWAEFRKRAAKPR